MDKRCSASCHKSYYLTGSDDIPGVRCPECGEFLRIIRGTLHLAELAVEAMKERENEDLEEWAERLAADAARLDD